MPGVCRQSHKFNLEKLNNQKAPPTLRARVGLFRFRAWLGSQQEDVDLLEHGTHRGLVLEEEGVIRVRDPEDLNVVLPRVGHTLHEQVIDRTHGQDWHRERGERHAEQRREDLQRRLSLLRMHVRQLFVSAGEPIRVMTRHHDVLDVLDAPHLDRATKVRTEHCDGSCEHSADYGPEEPHAKAFHPTEQGSADEQLRPPLAHSARELRTQRVGDHVRALVGDVAELTDQPADMIVVAVSLVGERDHLPPQHCSEELDDKAKEVLDMLDRLVSPCAREQDQRLL